MSSLEETINKIKSENRVGLMAHLVAGYRSLGESREAALALAGNGADVLEIQIPFSDPTADGPTITAACQEALKTGVKPADALKLAAGVISETGTAVLIMSYYNILYRWPGGPEGFLKEAGSHGVSGTIVPDIPPDEDAERYFELCNLVGLHPILVVSPNVSIERLNKLKPYASGFVYTTARLGTTGLRSEIGEKTLKPFIGALKETLSVPVAVGFGIRSREQIEELQGWADIAVVGTHFLQHLSEKGKEGITEQVKLLSGRR